MSDHEATLKSYLDQWNTYFGEASSAEEFLSRLRNFAFEGHLRSCKFRSVCWRVFLGCLPADIRGWGDAIKDSRNEYLKIKNLHVTKPAHEAEGKDLEVENPLSQNDESSWLKYFKNSELKTMIERDVRRTFPEMEYFHNEKVHELLVNVLFCYAQEHKDLSYRQGMHELLAPMVFIIHCDLQAACHAREIGQLLDVIDMVLDADFLEHDAYTMFCHLMESTNAWYSVTERGKREMKAEEQMNQNEGVAGNGSANSFPTKPFQPQEVPTPPAGPTLAITNKLNHIHDTLLVQHDLQLHCHLNNLEIIPQVFGLRWIRLLFGREFSLQDLLVLWDAIFADSHTLDLVDYLFVAMLIHIRKQLMSADYSSCMQILMKYPPVDDINDIVRAAKDIRLLKGRSYFDTQLANVTQNKSTSQSAKTPPSPQTMHSGGKQNSITRLFKDITRKVIPENKPNSSLLGGVNAPTPTDRPYLPANVHASMNVPNWAKNGTASLSRQRRTVTEAVRAEEMHRRSHAQLERKIQVLHLELDKMKEMCLFCSEKLASSVDILQSSVNISPPVDPAPPTDLHESMQKASRDPDEQEQFDRDQILITLAGLKQVRDLLQGTLTYNPDLREYKKEMHSSNKLLETEQTENWPEALKVPQSIVNSGAVNHEAGDD